MGAISFTELDATVGGETSNSYGTLDELKAYFANRDEASDLLAESDSALIARMIQATLINDTVLKAYGILASDEQSLEFPRKELVDKHGRSYADDIIPEKIKYAQFEQALYLYTNDISIPSILTQGFKEAKLDVMQIKLDKDFVPKKLAYDAIDFLELFGEVTLADSKFTQVQVIRY